MTASPPIDTTQDIPGAATPDVLSRQRFRIHDLEVGRRTFDPECDSHLLPAGKNRLCASPSKADRNFIGHNSCLQMNCFSRGGRALRSVVRWQTVRCPSPAAVITGHLRSRRGARPRQGQSSGWCWPYRLESQCVLGAGAPGSHGDSSAGRRPFDSGRISRRQGTTVAQTPITS